MGGRSKEFSIVVTGDTDESVIVKVLDCLQQITPLKEVIECGDSGAGLIARFWAEDNDIPVHTIRGDNPVDSANRVFRRRPDAVMDFGNGKINILDVATRKGVQICDVKVRDAPDITAT